MAILTYKKKIIVQLSNKFGNSCIPLLGIQLKALTSPTENKIYLVLVHLIHYLKLLQHGVFFHSFA